MGLRTALRQNTVVLVGLLAFGAWLFLTMLNVSASMSTIEYGDWIGQSGIVGLVGLLVMLALGVFIVVVYAELGETDPAPERFPPNE